MSLPVLPWPGDAALLPPACRVLDLRPSDHRPSDHRTHDAATAPALCRHLRVPVDLYGSRRRFPWFVLPPRGAPRRDPFALLLPHIDDLRRCVAPDAVFSAADPATGAVAWLDVSQDTALRYPLAEDSLPASPLAACVALAVHIAGATAGGWAVDAIYYCDSTACGGGAVSGGVRLPLLLPFPMSLPLQMLLRAAAATGTTTTTTTTLDFFEAEPDGGHSLRMLDLGCGAGRDIASFLTLPGCSTATAVGVDSWRGSCERARQLAGLAGFSDRVCILAAEMIAGGVLATAGANVDVADGFDFIVLNRVMPPRTFAPWLHMAMRSPECGVRNGSRRRPYLLFAAFELAPGQTLSEWRARYDTPRTLAALLTPNELTRPVSRGEGCEINADLAEVPADLLGWHGWGFDEANYEILCNEILPSDDNARPLRVLVCRAHETKATCD